MGTGSSLCYSDTDIPEYSPAYLGQIYAGVILNSAKSSSTGGYASTLSLNSLYASTLSLNSLCDTKKAASRRNSGAATGVLKVVRKGDIPLIDEVEEDLENLEEVHQEEEKELKPPLAEAESSQLSSLESVKEENKIILSQQENLEVLDQAEDHQKVKVLALFKSLPLCSDVAITE